MLVCLIFLLLVLVLSTSATDRLGDYFQNAQEEKTVECARQDFKHRSLAHSSTFLSRPDTSFFG